MSENPNHSTSFRSHGHKRRRANDLAQCLGSPRYHYAFALPLVDHTMRATLREQDAYRQAGLP